MTTAIAETTSRVDDTATRPSTRGMHSDDWVLPEIERQHDDAERTTSPEYGPRNTNGAVTTLPAAARRVSQPIRKDDLVIRFPSDRVKLLQQWECVVSAVHNDCVECELHDLTDESMPVECAEVYLDEFSQFDRELLHEGAVFYWSIGHEIKKTGQVRRYSELRVRRMPKLSKLMEREIAAKAKELSELFQSDS